MRYESTRAGGGKTSPTIIEFVGPGGVGKTTVEPLVADRLGIEYYPGKKRHGFDGEPLPPWRVWTGRAVAVAQNPRLSRRSIAIHNGSPSERARFALDMARRARIGQRAAGLDSGILASGPVHGLSMIAASTGVDVRPLIELAAVSDIYVVLHADPIEITRRLAGRLEAVGEELTGHEDWVGRYEDAARMILSAIALPTFEVNADAAPEEIAEEVAGLLSPLLTERADGDKETAG